MWIAGGSRAFLGYHRPDGQVGTRNYWIVVPLVFCENRNLAVLKQAFEEELGYGTPQTYRRQVAELAKRHREGKKITNLSALQIEPAKRPRSSLISTASASCNTKAGAVVPRETATNLCALIANYIHHPNVAGATVLSLGCQNAQIGMLREQFALRDPNSASRSS